MATTTRAVTRYRTRSVRRRGGRSRAYGSSGVSVAILLGFVPTVAEMVRQAQAGWAFKDILSTPVYNYTGYSMNTGQWTAKGLINGWAPVLAGVAVHWLANRFGVNRYVSRMTHGAISI